MVVIFLKESSKFVVINFVGPSNQYKLGFKELMFLKELNDFKATFSVCCMTFFNFSY